MFEIVGLIALMSLLMAAFFAWAVWTAYARYFEGWVRIGWVFMGFGILFLIGWAALETGRMIGPSISALFK